MKATYRQTLNGHEIHIGQSSWDDEERSIKFVYPDKSGKTSRGAPEVPIGVLVEMVIIAKEQNEFSADQIQKIKTAFCD
jgi:hypothetical protein